MDEFQKQKHRLLAPKLYSGKNSDNAQEFLTKIQNYFHFNKIEEGDKGVYFQSFLTGAAFNWWSCLEDKDNISDIETSFKHRWMQADEKVEMLGY